MTALLIIGIVFCGIWFIWSTVLAINVDEARGFAGVTAFLMAFAITIMSIALGM